MAGRKDVLGGARGWFGAGSADCRVDVISIMTALGSEWPDVEKRRGSLVDAFVDPDLVIGPFALADWSFHPG